MTYTDIMHMPWYDITQLGKLMLICREKILKSLHHTSYFFIVEIYQIMSLPIIDWMIWAFCIADIY